jgi:hypothetical protein
MSENELKTVGTNPRSRRFRRLVRLLPFLIGFLFGLLWALVYVLLGDLHGMWAMYDREFPFLLAKLLGLRVSLMPWRAGILLAFADGGVAGIVITWILSLIFLHGPEP